MSKSNFIDDLLGYFNEELERVSYTQEETTTKETPRSYKSYKSETYENGKLKNKIEKVWENGKLIKDEGETHQLECKTDCKCNRQSHTMPEKTNKCCWNAEDNAVKAIEDNFVKKLQLIEKEVDGLRVKLDESLSLNDRLIAENKALVEKYDEQQAKLVSLRDLLNEMV